MQAVRSLLELLWLLAILVALPTGIGAAVMALAVNHVSDGPLDLALFVEPMALLLVGGPLAWAGARRFPTQELRVGRARWATRTSAERTG